MNIVYLNVSNKFIVKYCKYKRNENFKEHTKVPSTLEKIKKVFDLKKVYCSICSPLLCDKSDLFIVPASTSDM